MNRFVPRLMVVCALFCAFALVSNRCQAQSTSGSLYGRVTDPSAAVVSGADTVALNQATGVEYKGRTNGLGNYTIANVPPGTYTVTAIKNGFQTAMVKDVTLAIDQKQLLNFELKVGVASDVMTVTAEPTMLQTQTAETGEVIQSTDILNLPLLGRNFTDLAQLTAGVTPKGGSINTFSYSVNGSREYANSIQIDGVEATTNRSQDITAAPSVDSVEEFKVSTSAYAAEFGRSAGGVVSIQTKSGTNKWHGSAYEFFRPNFTTAKDYGFDGAKVPASILKQHNYGGTFGGPIKKDKTFFFVSYEGMYQANAYNYVDSVPPLNQVKVLPDGSVDLSGLVDPLTGTQIPIYDPAVSAACYGGCYQQFAGNIIPANRVSPAGLKTLFDFFPIPNLPGTGNGWYKNFSVHSPTNQHSKSADARLDQNFSGRDRLSAIFHYNYADQLVTDPYYGHTVVPGAGDADQANIQDSGAQEYSITETHLFSSRFLNEARFGYTRYNLEQFGTLNGRDLANQYGVGNVNVSGFPATSGFPDIFLGAGYLTGGSSYKPLAFKDRNWQISDYATLSQLGRHEIKFGGDFRRLNSYPNFSLFPTGFWYFGGPYFSMTSDWSYTSPLTNYNALYGTGGSDIADLILGLPIDVYMGLQLTNPHTQSWEMDYFAQDTFKVTPRLTLTYGIRYEYQAPYTEAGNNTSNYDPGTDSILLAGRGSNSAALVNARRDNFAPRIGFAYQLHPKTVLRGGWGMFYSPENDAREDILTKNYPFAIQQSFNNIPYNGPPTYLMDTGIPRTTTVPIPAGASSIATSSIPNGSLETTYYETPNMRTGYSYLYNLSVERELSSSFALELSYVGSKSHDLSYQVGNINVNNVVTKNLGIIQTLTDQGWGEYNSLQAKLTKRVSKNLSFLAAYTWGHNLDNGPAPFDLGHINNDLPQDPRNLNAEIASADGDVRHNFTFSGLYRLPFGQGQAFFNNWSRTKEMLLGGWQFNTIVFLRTGTPINVIRNGNSTSTCQGARPNLIGDPHGNGSLSEYFNTAAFDSSTFTGPTQCDPGNAGRNLLTGPGYANADVSLFKEFQVKESAKLQTRLEVFNISNTPHYANPGSDESDKANFGVITRTTGNMRIVQLAAKFIF